MLPPAPRRPPPTAAQAAPRVKSRGKTLKDMGFRDVAYLEGGTEAWKEAGLPTEPPADH